MPICEQRNLLFIHVPKTGGSSIEKALGIDNIDCWYSERKCSFSMPDIINCFQGMQRLQVMNTTPQHLTAMQWSIAKPQHFAKCTKFAIIRNPYDRIVSEYHYAQNCKYDGIFVGFKQLTFDTFVKKVFNLSAMDRHIIFDNHFRCQSDFIYNDQNECVVDKVFTYENINEVFEWLNVTPQHERRSNNRKHWREYYNDELISIINYHYAKDFQLLAYDKY